VVVNSSLHPPKHPPGVEIFAHLQVKSGQFADIMNGLALRCIEGRAGPGMVIEVGGALEGRPVTHTFFFGEPGAREQFDAFQAHPDATGSLSGG